MNWTKNDKNAMSTNITHIWIYSWLVATACMAAYFALVIICHENFFIIKYISEILDRYTKIEKRKPSKRIWPHWGLYSVLQRAQLLTWQPGAIKALALSARHRRTRRTTAAAARRQPVAQGEWAKKKFPSLYSTS